MDEKMVPRMGSFLQGAGRLHRRDNGDGVVALVDGKGRERILMPQDLADQLETEVAPPGASEEAKRLLILGETERRDASLHHLRMIAGETAAKDVLLHMPPLVAPKDPKDPDPQDMGLHLYEPASYLGTRPWTQRADPKKRAAAKRARAARRRNR